MNNTIDFKTAFFSIMHMAMKNELGKCRALFRRNLAGSGFDGYPS